MDLLWAPCFFWAPNARTEGEISLRPAAWSGNNASKVMVLRDDTKHDLVKAAVSLSLEGEAS